MYRSFGRISKLTLSLLAISVLSLTARGETVAQNRILQAVEGGKVSAIAGSIHPMAQSRYDQGPVTGGTELHGMSINFAPSAAQQAALTALLKAQQDPASPSYHHWLTTEQYGARFGMTQSDLGKVTAWLQSQGFTVDKVAESSNIVWFSGNAAMAEAAFHTQIHTYLVDGETHFANSTEVSVPSAFAGTVIDVGGLNDFRLKPQFVRSLKASAKGFSPDFTSGSSGNHFLTPGDLAVIYDLNPLYTASFTGTGQTIGIIGQTQIVQQDITNFRAAAGLSVNNPIVYVVPGTNPSIGYGGDLVEADLDLEYSGGTAPNAFVDFVTSNDVITSLKYAITNSINGLKIPILSMSYSGCEANQGISYVSLEVILQQANTQGQTVLSSSGDTGAAACDVSETVVITSAANGPAVGYPASSAYVTGVGGSEFMGDGTAENPQPGGGTYWNYTSGTDIVTSAKSYIPEMGWNDTTFAIANGDGLSASGGGASILFTKPSWQTGVAGIPNDSARDVPDISLAASPAHDPYLMCTQIVLASSAPGTYTSSCGNGFRVSDPTGNDNNGLFEVGGTSASSPAFAGILSLIEQKLGTSLGNINPTLYQLASNASTYATAFHDVTTGSNIVPCTAGSTGCPGVGDFGFSAGVGYDQVTGLGTADGNNLATAFASAETTPGTTTTVTFSPAAPVVEGAVTLTATVVATSGTATPAGSVVFTVDGTALPAVDVTASGTADTAVGTTSTSFSTGGIHTVSATYTPGTGDNFFASTGSTSITVAATGVIPTTTTVVLAPATTIAIGGSLTINATVTADPATGTLPGTVNFFVGTSTTPLNAAPVAVTPTTPGVGTASYTDASVQTSQGFVVGANTITAHYTGTGSYTASSGTATITVTNPGITAAVGNITISSANPGNSGMSTITITSTGGYAGSVNLTASSTTLDAEAGITSNPLTVTSSTAGTTTITVTTIAADVQKGVSGNLKKSQTRNNNRVIAGAAVAFGAIFLLAVPGLRRKRWPMLTALLLLAGLSAGMGCGGGSGGGGGGGGATPAGTYTVTLTATDSLNTAITTSTTFTVTIQ